MVFSGHSSATNKLYFVLNNPHYPTTSVLKFVNLLFTAGSADKTDTNFGGKNGVKSIRVSPDGQHLASGDRTGNIRQVH